MTGIQPARRLEDGTEIRTMPAAYYVTAWPDDLADVTGSFHWYVKVENRGLGADGDVWAVSNDGACLSASGEWDYEPASSERTGDWLSEHRFPLDRALELAREACLTITAPSGMDTRQVIAWHRARKDD